MTDRHPVAHGQPDRLPSVLQLRALPVLERRVVQNEHVDVRGHMNIHWYFAAGARAIEIVCESLGIDESYRETLKADLFTVEHHLRYLAELKLGDSYSTCIRIDAVSKNAVCLTAYIADDTHERLAGTMEATLVNVDLRNRRAVPFQPRTAQALESRRQSDDSLPWKLSGYGRLRP